jgi:hypothetical protein
MTAGDNQRSVEMGQEDLPFTTPCITYTVEIKE